MVWLTVGPLVVISLTIDYMIGMDTLDSRKNPYTSSFGVRAIVVEKTMWKPLKLFLPQAKVVDKR